ncbi:MAG: PAS domain-containing sensor histidine kinase [Candidatus Margulisbacteria bacterium]|nr:PAS domain-containing sensor histidine kinase [Candidatus Margulisiibacteriota bacterium]
MKLENNDLEKIIAITREAALAADLPFIFLAIKKEDTPHFEIVFMLPDRLKLVKEKAFLSSVNPFVGRVYEGQGAAFADDPHEGLKNILGRDDIEGLAHELRAKSAGLCPIIVEKNVQGMLLFLAKDNLPRTLKTVESFAKQVASLFTIREFQRLAHDANARSRSMIESSQNLFFTIDTVSSQVKVSPRLEEMTGYTQSEFLQSMNSPDQYVVKDDLQKARDFYRDAFGGKKTEAEFRMIRKDGNQVWFNIISNPIFDSNGKLVAIQGIGKDVSEHKKATWELEKTREREQLKTEFMSVISHELRTPLTPIQGYTDMLLSGGAGPLTNEQKESLTIIKKQSKRLLNLIDSVLDITKVEYGKRIEIKKEPVSLNAIIEEVIDGMNFQFKEKEIKPEVELSPEIETILADEAKTTRVLSNLLGNALKFTPKKGRIGIRTAKVAADAQVEVWDSGVGIENEHLANIFEKFYQVDSSYTRTVGGIGMGLAIVKDIVEGHGGKVWAESGGLGKGTKFIFTLPLS